MRTCSDCFISRKTKLKPPKSLPYTHVVSVDTVDVLLVVVVAAAVVAAAPVAAAIDAVSAAVLTAVFVVADVLNYIYTVPTYSD